MVIYKYDLQLTDEQTLEMPGGAKPFFVAMQQGALRLWARVEETNSPTSRTFRVVGADNSFADVTGCVYIGTVVDGTLAWHVFEQEPP